MIDDVDYKDYEGNVEEARFAQQTDSQFTNCEVVSTKVKND